MNRREFLFCGIARQSKIGLAVEVIEVFSSLEGPSALLVHHATEATRNAFSEWLRANDGKQVLCRGRDGFQIKGQVFRMRLCFGRGLILTPSSVAVRLKDVLTIT
jgi:hypothetical protein